MKFLTLSSVIAAACGLLFGCSSVHPAARSESNPKAPLAVSKTFQLGGEGGWDYATLNDDGSLLFLPRTTHVMVVDTVSGKSIADFGSIQRGHGVALVPGAGRGFVTDGKAGTVTAFDLKTYAVLGQFPAADDADGIIFDAASQRLFVVCGDANAVVPIDPNLDLKTGKADAAIDLGGKPEFLAADGRGRLYVNLEDKNLVAVVDTKTMKVLTKWSTGTGTEPVGLSLDPERGRLFVGCRNQKMIVIATATGSVLAELPIGRGVDATAFNAGVAYASCGDGTLTEIRETSPMRFEVVGQITTAAGARTMAIDRRSGMIYLPAAEMDPPAQPNGRPRPRPGTFKVLVVK